jgi:hypothetical protein
VQCVGAQLVLGDTHNQRPLEVLRPELVIQGCGCDTCADHVAHAVPATSTSPTLLVNTATRAGHYVVGSKRTTDVVGSKRTTASTNTSPIRGGWLSFDPQTPFSQGAETQSAVALPVHGDNITARRQVKHPRVAPISGRPGRESVPVQAAAIVLLRRPKPDAFHLKQLSLLTAVDQQCVACLHILDGDLLTLVFA